MARLLASLILVICLALATAFVPSGVQSLSPTMTMRQSRRLRSLRAFKSFRGLNRRPRRRRRLVRECRPFRNSQFRTLNGFCNNLANPGQGAADDTFLLLARPLRSPAAGFKAPNPRRISNIVCNEDSPIPNDRGMSEFVTFFGQFLDHTVTFVPTNENEPKPIRVLRPDPVFKPTQIIPFFRSETGPDGAPLNELSSYVDAASIYGVGEDEARALRELSGGRLSLPENLLPRDDDGQFLAGDSRANENINLIAVHTLWAREHNTVAAEVASAFPAFNDEQIYQLARHIVSAELQAVVYEEFIPALTGRKLPPYRGYRPNVKAVVSNRFSTAGFRVGHTLLNSTITSISAQGKVTNFLLRDTFFKPEVFIEATIEGLLRGMTSGFASEVDNGITGEVRNFLIDAPESEEQLDLPALNIQRGRDHRLPTCNTVRRSVGLRPFTSINQITTDANVRRRLRSAFNNNVNLIDTWVCGISEDHANGSSLGPLFDRIVRTEFTRLRDGDRFFFQRRGYFTARQIRLIPTIRKLVGPNNELGTIMRSIIVRNTDLRVRDIGRSPFFV